jgi:hypothetical protein
MLLAAEEGQYSFQIYDGSLVQIFYAFDNDGATLKSARLAYYGSPDSHRTRRRERPHFDLDSEITNWIRFDYNRDPARGVLESPCHLHFGGLPRLRMMVRRVPNPKQFIELLLGWCYPDEYASHRLDASGCYKALRKIQNLHKPALTVIDEHVCLWTSHLFVPVGRS